MYVADFFTIERFFISAYFRVYVGMQIMNVMSKYVMKLSTIYKVFHRSMENVSMTKREKYIHLASVIEFDLKNSPFLCFFRLDRSRCIGEYDQKLSNCFE